MSITWQDLTVSFDHLDRNKLIEDWVWLVGKTASPILITSVGDIFLQETSGEVYWLITGSGEYSMVAKSMEEFKEKLNNEELVNEWFLVNLVSDLKESGLILQPGSLYGFKQLPVLGGVYAIENFELTDIEVYFAVSGQMNCNIKDLSDGTQVRFTVTE